MFLSSSQPQKQPVIEYPVKIDPDPISIESWRHSTTGTPYVHSFTSDVPGPHVMITALLHGNEIAGGLALDRLLRSGLRPSRGRLTLAFANVEAYASFNVNEPRASRWADEDMNRVWAPDVLRSQHPNDPIVLAGPLERSRQLAYAMGLAKLIVVDKGHSQGRRMRDYGSFGTASKHNTALLIEAGQHWAASSVEVAYAACIKFLVGLNVVSEGLGSPPSPYLPQATERIVEITIAVTIKHEFVFTLPLRGGEVIPKAGTPIGYDGEEVVRTPHDDCVVVMPSQHLWAGLTAVRLGREISIS